MVSAAFKINGTAVSDGNPVEVTQNTTITLSLVDSTDFKSASWEAFGIGYSGSALSLPTITKTGTQLGTSATFTMPDGECTLLIRCTVTDTANVSTSAEGAAYVPTSAGRILFAEGELFHIDATLGVARLNQMISDFDSATAGAGYTVIQNEGANLTTRTKLNFIGAVVDAADDAGNTRTNITITGGEQNLAEVLVQDNATDGYDVDVSSGDAINFLGEVDIQRQGITVLSTLNGDFIFGDVNGGEAIQISDSQVITMFGDITNPDGYTVILSGLTYPNVDGTNGQVIGTDGAGNLSFVTVSTSAETLNETLSAGNITDGYDIVISTGDVINFNDRVIIQSGGDPLISETPGGALNLKAPGGSFISLDSGGRLSVATPTTGSNATTKTYVDNLVAAVDTSNSLSDVLVIGNSTAGYDILISSGDVISAENNVVFVNAKNAADDGYINVLATDASDNVLLGVGDDGYAVISTTTDNNVSLIAVPTDWADGLGVIFIGEGDASPEGIPVNGGLLYVESGELKYKGPSGTETTLAPS